MSSGRTQNLKLCLWERDDAVKMEDFNEDNAKIDAAVAAARAEAKADAAAVNTAIAEATAAAAAAVSKAESENMMVKLMDITVSGSNVYTLSLDLSSIDFTQYSYLKLCNVNSTSELYIRVNGKTAGYKTGIGTYSSSGMGSIDFHLWCTPIRFDNGSILDYVSSVTPSNFETIQLMNVHDASTALTVGRKFALLGVKM